MVGQLAQSESGVAFGVHLHQLSPQKKKLRMVSIVGIPNHQRPFRFVCVGMYHGVTRTTLWRFRHVYTSSRPGSVYF